MIEKFRCRQHEYRNTVSGMVRIAVRFSGEGITEGSIELVMSEDAAAYYKVGTVYNFPTLIESNPPLVADTTK